MSKSKKKCCSKGVVGNHIIDNNLADFCARYVCMYTVGIWLQRFSRVHGKERHGK